MDVSNPISIGVSTELRQIDGRSGPAQAMFRAFREHWPEYLLEALGLGIFMLSACTFTVFLYHPHSPITQLIPSDMLRRVLMGLAMGLTAIAIIFSPFGKRSGAHINPSVTLTFFRLGKIAPSDAAFYTLFQFMGGVLGVVFAGMLFGTSLAHQSVNYAVTVPGPSGSLAAFGGEITISFIQMSVVLLVSNNKRLSHWTGLFAGAAVATYIALESPISGMSMNPARSFGSASVAHVWTSLWIYFIAPPLGMLLAAEVYKTAKRGREVACAKFHHHNDQRCIFRCNFER